jgi:MoxR-like ATPase
MEEQQVTVDGESRPLPQPFFVIATQNPIDLEGTFPLPEAQLDRFMLRVSVGYPDKSEEVEILERFERENPLSNAKPVTDALALLELRKIRAEVTVSDEIRSYLLDVVRATRDDEQILLGASPRSALALQRACQAWALLQGRSFVTPDDVKALAVPVLAHRTMLTAQARLRNVSQSDAIALVLGRVDVPVEEELGAVASIPSR